MKFFALLLGLSLAGSSFADEGDFTLLPFAGAGSRVNVRISEDGFDGGIQADEHAEDLLVSVNMQALKYKGTTFLSLYADFMVSTDSSPEFHTFMATLANMDLYDSSKTTPEEEQKKARIKTQISASMLTFLRTNVYTNPGAEPFALSQIEIAKITIDHVIPVDDGKFQIHTSISVSGGVQGIIGDADPETFLALSSSLTLAFGNGLSVSFGNYTKLYTLTPDLKLVLNPTGSISYAIPDTALSVYLELGTANLFLGADDGIDRYNNGYSATVGIRGYWDPIKPFRRKKK
ncbi:MAG: hypothetical protein HOE90_23505 [Bacteriovoracaceae bacterium]|nr:hypothetical protein [Bacteriovoracaceae bacterium]